MKNDLLLRSLYKEKTERPPIWLMRQAGRYMKDYQSLRKNISFMELCKTPEIAAHATMLPLKTFGFDAAILFSDILIPLEPMGVKCAFTPSPEIYNPVRCVKDAEKLNSSCENELDFVYETVKILKNNIEVPLIGFAAGPFTSGCYITEGKGSKDFTYIRKMMHDDSRAYDILMEKLTEHTAKYLNKQIENGCDAVQIFDTWAGILTEKDYMEKVYPWIKQLINTVSKKPVIYFVKDSSHLLSHLTEIECACIGLDWKINIKKANDILNGRYCLQGNMDPVHLLTDKKTIKKNAESIINDGKEAPGHIFNLGHGILPETPEENVKYLVDIVKGIA